MQQTRIRFMDSDRGGREPQERSLLCTEKTAAKRYLCVLCPEAIEPGQLYWIDGNNATRLHSTHLADGSAIRVFAAADRPGPPNDVELLLAGLEVGSISELRRIVLASRESVMVGPTRTRPPGERLPINIAGAVRTRLRDFLYLPEMRGVGYSEFITRALDVAEADLEAGAT